MIVDVHVHIHPFPTATNGLRMPRSYEEETRRDLTRLGIPPEAQAETAVARMDAAGVDACIVVNPHRPPESGHVRTNQSVHDTIAPFKGRIYALAGISVYPKPDLDELEFAITKLGFRGLKINVSGQKVRPSSFELLDPLYRKLIELDVPVMFHPGPSSIEGPDRFEFDVRDYYDLARRHPDLRVVIAHAGNSALGGFDLALTVASACKNVYLDASGLLYRSSFRHLPPAPPGQARWKNFTLSLLYPEGGEVAPELREAWERTKATHNETLREICNRAPGKLMYGTDLPFIERWDVSVPLHRETLRDDTVFAQVMGETARQVFGLE